MRKVGDLHIEEEKERGLLLRRAEKRVGRRKETEREGNPPKVEVSGINSVPCTNGGCQSHQICLRGDPQTTDHIVSSCPLTKFEGGLTILHCDS